MGLGIFLQKVLIVENVRNVGVSAHYSRFRPVYKGFLSRIFSSFLNISHKNGIIPPCFKAFPAGFIGNVQKVTESQESDGKWRIVKNVPLPPGL